MDKVIVNPTFRSDIDGKLFKNKDTNKDIQETVIFNALTTRLSIYKGDLALFPNIGLKQHLFNFSFEDESGAITREQSLGILFFAIPCSFFLCNP